MYARPLVMFVSVNDVPVAEEATVVNDPDDELLPVCFRCTRKSVNAAGAVQVTVMLEPSPAATSVRFVGGLTPEVDSVVRVTDEESELSLPLASTALTR